MKWFVIGIMMLLPVGSCLAQATDGVDRKNSSAADQQALAKDLDGKRGEQQVDLFTGSFGYSIPIQCAPARNGSEPALALRYSSGGDNGWCGMGWKLDIGHIERNTKDGFPIKYSTANPPAPTTAYDNSKGFLLNLFGKELKLLPTGTTNEFDAEVDTDFLHCVLDTTNNQWRVYDKSGNVYYFGQIAGSRVANPKAGWSGYTATFQWALDQIDTVTGDRTTIVYTNYAASPDTGLAEMTIYPFQITYNSHASINGYTASYPGTNIITFGTEIRPDRRFSYRWGFRTEQNRRLTNIVCRVDGQKVWRYVLSYTNSPATRRSLLKSLTVYGADDGTPLPVQTFNYQGNPNVVSFGSVITWTNLNLGVPGTPSATLPYVTEVDNNTATIADLMDIDGDGLPDRVCFDFTNYFWAQRNLGIQPNGHGAFGPRFAFGPTATSTSSVIGANNPIPGSDDAWAGLNSQRVRIRDINGDGLPDKLCDYWFTFSTYPQQDASTYTNIAVLLNTGTGFASVVAWTNINPGPGAVVAGDNANYYDCIESGGVNVGFMDINGDGLPDRILATYYAAGAMTNFLVQFNTGTNFTAAKVFGPYRSLNWNNYNGGQTSFHEPFYWAGVETPNVHMIDINGDGLPDRIMWPMDPNNPGLEAYINPLYTVTTNYCVEFNDGYSFESTNTDYTHVPRAFNVWPGVKSQGNFPGYNYAAMMNLPFVGMFDLNGDGLPDRVMLDETNLSSPKWLVYLNYGRGFETNAILVTNIYDPSGIGDEGWCGIQSAYAGNAAVTLMDMNGDGLLDRVMTVDNNDGTKSYFWVQLNQGPAPDLLTAISNGIGGSITVSYKSSTTCPNYRDPANTNSGSLLPFPQQVVANVAEYDGINSPRTNSYGYAGGFYDGNRREFHGFAVVTNTDASLRKTVTYFHQGGGQSRTNLGEYLDPANFAKEGMPYRVETYGNDNNLYSVAVSQINQTGLGNGRYFPFVQLTFDCDYPGPKVTATKFVYDASTGNLTNKIVYGQVTGFDPNNVGSFAFTDSDGSDTRYYDIHFASISSNSYILDHPDTTSLTDTNHAVVQETKYTYNSQSGTIASKLTRIAAEKYATNGYGAYNTYGLVTLTTNPVGVVTEISYESTYNTFPATSRIRANPGQDSGNDMVTTTSYDPRSGQLGGSTDPMGVTVTNTYDTFYRLTESDKIPAGGGAAVWMKKAGYNLGVISAGTAASYIAQTNNDGVGGVESRTYIDGFGRPVQTRTQGENGNYRVVSTAYDERGNTFLTTWPQFQNGAGFSKPSGNPMATWIGFDAAGRVATNRPVTATFNATTGAFSSKNDSGGDVGTSPLAARTWSYVNGTDPWWIICTDEDGKVRRYQLDAFGHTNQIQEVDGASTYSTTLRYDLAGNLTNIVNHYSENIYFAYNDAGGLVAMADPYLGQWTYQRDYAGRLRVQTDGRGNVVSNSYVNPSGQQDPLGRLQVQTVYGTNYSTHVLVPAFTNTYTYDSNGGDNTYAVYTGLLYKTTDSEGWEKNGYDNRGRLIKTTRHLNLNNQDYTTGYTYNDGDSVASIAYPNSGPTITNLYFTGGSLKQVSLFGTTSNYYTVTSAAYIDEFGHVTNFSYGNGLTTKRSYYSTSKRLQSIVCGSVFTRTFTYSNSDDIASISGTGISGTIGVTYDNLHRIKSYSGLPGSYGYDAVGSMTTNIESGSAQVYGYGVRRPQAVKTAFGTTNLYDLCGNMIVRHGGTTNSQALVYDAENRLVRLSQAGTNFLLVQFGYAGDGSRLWKWANQNPTNLQVWIGNIYEEKNGKVLFHVFAGGQQVCTFETNSALFGGNDTNRVAYYYHEDSLNSSSALSDSSQNQVEMNVYYPFGRAKATTPQAGFQVSRRFTGQVLDAESGLYYYNARYYDPELGRFIQADDIIPDLGNPQSYNRYSYVMNNPLRYTDPNGHYGVSDWWRDVGQGKGIVSGWVSSAGRSIANTVKKPFVVPKSAPEPYSYQSLMEQNGTPLFPDMTGANNPAILVVKTGGGALLEAAMWYGGPGEEKAAFNVADRAWEARRVAKIAGVLKVGEAANAITKLKNLDVVVGFVKEGKIVGQFKYGNNPALALSHEQLAGRLGLLTSEGKLKEGVEAFTVAKQNGNIGIRGSENFVSTVTAGTEKLLKQKFQ